MTQSTSTSYHTLHGVQFPSSRWHPIEKEATTESQGHLFGFFNRHERKFQEINPQQQNQEVVERLWNSRQHRKGKTAKRKLQNANKKQNKKDEVKRHEADKPQKGLNSDQFDTDVSASKTKQQHPAPHPISRALVFCPCPCWPVPVWTAFLFTLGSAFWISNAIFGFHEPVHANHNYSAIDRNAYWGAATGFFGGLSFFIGGWTTLWEALNQENSAEFDEEETTREQRLVEAINKSMFLRTMMKMLCGSCKLCFAREYNRNKYNTGASTENEAAGEEGDIRTPLAMAVHKHKFDYEDNSNDSQDEHSLLDGVQSRSPMSNKLILSQQQQPPQQQQHIEFQNTVLASDGTQLRDPKWRWFGWNSIHDLGFMAAWTQWIGTQIFFVSVLFGWPTTYVYTEDCCAHSSALWIVFFWVPQIIGATFLLISSVLMQLECQSSWWKIRPFSLPWHVAFWNIWGSAGFLMSGLGGAIWNVDEIHQRYWAVYFSTYFGSYSYFLGSVLQFIEARYS